MKDLTYLNSYRVDLFGDEHNGAFIIPSQFQKHKYFVIASDGEE